MSTKNVPTHETVTADNYKPRFLQGVTVTNLNGTTSPVNPVYCLEERSAQQLAVILKDLAPQIVMAYPSKMMLSVSALVPWFKFASGCAVNAGVEANYWSNASGQAAENNCRKDIAAACQQYQDSPEGGDQYPPQLQAPYGSPKS